MFSRSASAASALSGSTCFSTGTDSPVSAASAICRSRHRTSLRSAGTLSPDWRSTTSPGTIPTESIRVFCPPRITVASVTSVLPKASIAWSALPSWRKPTIALTSTTPRITAASIHSSSAAVTTVATSRI